MFLDPHNILEVHFLMNNPNGDVISALYAGVMDASSGSPF